VDWRVEYYRDFRGREPVKDFVESLQTETRAKILRMIKAT